VDLLDNAVDSATGTIRVKGIVVNGDHRLWPAESVEAVLTLGIERGAVTIPKAAIQQNERGWYAFVVKPDRTADLRIIRTGVDSETKVVVLDGIRPDEEVVTDGQLRLRPGVTVRIAKESGPLMREASQ
jgi:multidrug efflux system membrane fusion protein